MLNFILRPKPLLDRYGADLVE